MYRAAVANLLHLDRTKPVKHRIRKLNQINNSNRTVLAGAAGLVWLTSSRFNACMIIGRIRSLLRINGRRNG